MTSIHKKHITLLAAILLAAGTLTADTTPGPPPRFLLESKILSSEDILPLAAAPDPIGVIGNNEEVRVLFGTWQANDEVSMLSSPTIKTSADQEAVIRVQSVVQYFERTKDGTLALRSLPEDESAGIRLSTTMSKTENKSQISIKVGLQVNTLRDREKLPGVSLDIGRPLMQTRRIKTQMVVPLGQWMWLRGEQLQDVASGKREHLLILLRVTRADSD